MVENSIENISQRKLDSAMRRRVCWGANVGISSLFMLALLSPPPEGSSFYTSVSPLSFEQAQILGLGFIGISVISFIGLANINSQIKALLEQTKV